MPTMIVSHWSGTPERQRKNNFPIWVVPAFSPGFLLSAPFTGLPAKRFRPAVDGGFGNYLKNP